MPRRKSKKTTRARRPARRRAAPKRIASGALAKARARIAELEAENRRLREELALTQGGTLSGRSPDQDDGPLAPGM